MAANSKQQTRNVVIAHILRPSNAKQHNAKKSVLCMWAIEKKMSKKAHPKGNFFSFSKFPQYSCVHLKYRAHTVCANVCRTQLQTHAHTFRTFRLQLLKLCSLRARYSIRVHSIEMLSAKWQQYKYMKFVWQVRRARKRKKMEWR